MSETRRYRVLDAPRDDGWLFVPVDPGAAPAPDETGTPGREGGEQTTTDDPGEEGGSDSPPPGVPEVGSVGGAASESAPAQAEPPDPDHAYEPVAVPARGHGDLDEAVDALLPGYLVRAALSWDEPEPRVRSLSVQRRTLFGFADEVVNLFEAAETAWREAAVTGEPMTSRVTRDPDGRVNGVLYVFADGDGADRLAEFRSGRRPLEPLLARVNAAAPEESVSEGWQPDGPSVSVGPSGIRVDAPAKTDAREVFVLRPADGPFVVVLIALRKGGTLANTMRDTYNCPRPEEPE